MMNSYLCGIQNNNMSYNKGAHGIMKSAQKYIRSDVAVKQSSQIKYKKSLKYELNNLNSNKRQSIFKRDSVLTTDKKALNYQIVSDKDQQSELSCSKLRLTYQIKPFGWLKQNRRIVQDVQNQVIQKTNQLNQKQFNSSNYNYVYKPLSQKARLSGVQFSPLIKQINTNFLGVVQPQKQQNNSIIHQVQSFRTAKIQKENIPRGSKIPKITFHQKIDNGQGNQPISKQMVDQSSLNSQSCIKFNKSYVKKCLTPQPNSINFSFIGRSHRSAFYQENISRPLVQTHKYNAQQSIKSCRKPSLIQQGFCNHQNQRMKTQVQPQEHLMYPNRQEQKLISLEMPFKTKFQNIYFQRSSGHRCHKSKLFNSTNFTNDSIPSRHKHQKQNENRSPLTKCKSYQALFANKKINNNQTKLTQEFRDQNINEKSKAKVETSKNIQSYQSNLDSKSNKGSYFNSAQRNSDYSSQLYELIQGNQPSQLTNLYNLQKQEPMIFDWSCSNNDEQPIINQGNNLINRNRKHRYSFFADIQKIKKRQLTKVHLQGKITQQNSAQIIFQNENITNQLFTLEGKNGQSLVQSQEGSSEADSQVEYVLHSSNQIKLRSLAHLRYQPMNKMDKFN